MENTVVIIGASIADVIGKPLLSLRTGDSNPGKVIISAGGVARNIAENIKRLGENVTLITAIGNDILGQIILNNANEIKIDMNHSIIHNEKPTSVYVLITNNKGNPELAVSDTDIIDEISSVYIKSKHNIICKHKLIVADTNLSVESINYLIDNFKNIPVFIDLVSTTKALKVKNIIGKFHTIKPNIKEAEVLSGIKYKTDRDLLKIRDYFLKQGVIQLFVSMGEKGSFYANSETYGFIKAADIQPVNSSGAGDAYMSGLVYGFINKKTISESASFAASCSVVSMLHEKAVNPEMSISIVNEYITKYF